MRIRFLGTGAATSFPLAFCQCETCRKARKLGGRNIRKRSSLLINEDLLIDLGPDSIAAMHSYAEDPSRLRILLQTHPHSDHFDAGHLVTRSSKYTCVDAAPLEIVAEKRCLEVMADQVREIEGFELLEEKWQQDMRLKVTSLGHGERLCRGNYKILALESLHRSDWGSQIYLIEQEGKQMLYAVDSPALSERALRCLKDEPLDLLVFEQTFGFNTRKPAGAHVNETLLLEQVASLKALGSVNPETLIYITHISHEGNPCHDELTCRLSEYGLKAAWDGLELQL